MKYLLIFLISASFYTASCSYSRQIGLDNICDSTTFNINNNANDTSKVIYIRGAVFDTTACMLHGLVVDKETYQPIKNAQILFRSPTITFKSMTDSIGEFTFFSNGICGTQQWILSIHHETYLCSLIKYKQYHGGQWLKIKLERK